MCLSQESLERAGMRQELMPFVYKLTKFSFEFTVQDVVVFRTSYHFHTNFPDMLLNPIQTMLHFEHVTLLRIVLFFLFNVLKDALHNFNIGSIQ